MAQQIRVFKRKAWVRNRGWPGGFEPYVGLKRTVCYVEDIEEARRICAEHNDQRKRQDDPFCEFESA